MPEARILVVEDESITAMDIEERLQRLGYSVPGVVSSAEEAIRKAEETHPDLVLMDIVLSGPMDGLQAAQELQSRFGIPVVYLTAYSDNATFERVKGTEPFGYLVKPVKDRDLHRSIEIAIHRREAEKKSLDRERWIGQFADCSGIAMMTFDENALLTFLNSAAKEWTGLNPPEALGKSALEVFDLPGRGKTFTSIAKAVTNCLAADVAYEAWLVAKEGDENPVRYSVVPIVEGGGKKNGAILFFQLIEGAGSPGPAVEDSSNALETVAERDDEPDAGEDGRQQALRAIKALVYRSPQAAALLEPNGRLLMCNSGFENLFLYSEREAMGKKLDELILLQGPEAETYELSRSVLAGEAIHTTGFRQRKGGNLVVVEFDSVPIVLQGKVRALHVSYQDISQRIWEEGRLREQAASDPLTGLANSRWFTDTLAAEIRRSERTRRTFSLLLLDLDDLKKINDLYGHSAGSRALCRLADVLRTHCRLLDTAARYGGDEFAVILPESGGAAAAHVAHRISQELAGGSEKPPITVSIGSAVYPHDGETAEALLEAADRALYEMKRRRGLKGV